LKRGGNGGGEREANFEGKSYIVCVEGSSDDWLKCVKCHYVDLHTITISSEDPLKRLIAESDLLSRGFERQYSDMLS
jgi:hypothetical protein